MVVCFFMFRQIPPWAPLLPLGLPQGCSEVVVEVLGPVELTRLSTNLIHFH